MDISSETLIVIGVNPPRFSASHLIRLQWARHARPGWKWHRLHCLFRLYQKRPTPVKITLASVEKPYKHFCCGDSCVTDFPSGPQTVAGIRRVYWPAPSPRKSPCTFLNEAGAQLHSCQPPSPRLIIIIGSPKVVRRGIPQMLSDALQSFLFWITTERKWLFSCLKVTASFKVRNWRRQYTQMCGNPVRCSSE